MDVIITILEFLAVLAVVVVVHEFGHFATAKAFGIKVNEFAFGFPPRLLGVRKGETLYAINLVPIGGYVKLEGENDPSHPRSLASKGVGTRFIVLAAGPFMNAVLAIVLLAGLLMFTVEELRVSEVLPGSPAEGAGVLAEDAIIKVNGDRVTDFDELSDRISLGRGASMLWLIRRDGSEHTVQVTPRLDPPPGEGATGISVRESGRQQLTPTRWPWEAVADGASRIGLIFTLSKDAFSDWVTEGGQAPFAGPVGIARGTGEVTEEFGLISLIPLAALFSMSLAVFNILPIPALDGGRLMFVILEWVRRGKRIPPEKEGIVHLVGFFCLIALLLAITYNDIVNIVEGNSLLR